MSQSVNIRLPDPQQVSVKDLRSQVVREACITVAYMSQVFSHKADRFVENLLQSIVNLIQNSAKVSHPLSHYKLQTPILGGAEFTNFEIYSVVVKWFW